MPRLGIEECVFRFDTAAAVAAAKHNLGVFTPNITEYAAEMDDDDLDELKELIASDLPGRFPIESARGHKYLFILYDYDANYIQAVPIKSRKSEELIRGFNATYKVLLKNTRWW